jgi:RecA/RadA recombinase
VGWIELQDLHLQRKILCQDGEYSKVREILPIGTAKIVDISVEHPERCYFSNGMLSHNSGKSYLAALTARNAQKAGKKVIYFDSESAISPEFLESCGMDISENGLVYVQAMNVEMVGESIEFFLQNGRDYFFVWDSIAMTPTVSDVEGDFDPQSSMAMKPRVLSKLLSKLIIPIANTGSTLLCLNQLKTVIGLAPVLAKLDDYRYFAPGGNSLKFAYSLDIWLTKPKGKDSFVYDAFGSKIGTTVKVRVVKSRFGTEGRRCEFKIMWGGGNPHVKDVESWFPVVVQSSECEVGKVGKYIIKLPSGKLFEFKESTFEQLVEADAEAKEYLAKILDYELITKFANNKGDITKNIVLDDDEGD